jgi:crossover junction endodeoxyribonuclease RuvC
VIPVILGVDVGLSGALAALRGPEVLLLADLPTIRVQRGRGARREYLAGELAQLVRDVLAAAPAGAPVHAVVERQGARPGQGLVSAFSLGYGTGLIAGVLATLSVPLELEAPATWKKALGLPPGAGKGASLELAARLFPHAHVARRDGRAEALLLALYGQRRLAAAREAA